MAQLSQEITTTRRVLFPFNWRNTYQQTDMKNIDDKLATITQELQKQNLTRDTICTHHFIAMRLRIAKYVKNNDKQDLSAALAHFLQILTYVDQFQPTGILQSSAGSIMRVSPTTQQIDFSLLAISSELKVIWENAFVEFDYLYADDQQLREMVSTQLTGEQRQVLSKFVNKARSTTSLDPNAMTRFPEMDARTKVDNTLLKATINQYSMGQFCQRLCLFTAAVAVPVAAAMASQYLSQYNNTK